MNVTKQELLSLTDEQFRLLMWTQCNAHERQLSELRTLLKENTVLTKNSNDKLAMVFAIMNFSEVSANRIVKFGRFLSGTAKVLLPIALLYGLIIGMYHGHWPTIKDLM